VITILADLLGFEAHGIELDPRLVEVAPSLARRHGSRARFEACCGWGAGARGGGPRCRDAGYGDIGGAGIGLKTTKVDATVTPGRPAPTTLV
jgi:hypothetical protein